MPLVCAKCNCDLTERPIDAVCISCAAKLSGTQPTLTNNARAKFSPDCCDESKQDLRDWIECGFKFCPWCGRELRPIA